MIVLGVVTGASPEDDRLSKRADLVSHVALSLILALWVLRDAAERKRRICYDFDSFVFFAWPFVIPIYLFQTRGVRAFLTILGFGGLWFVAMAVAVVVLILRELILPA
jgi:hypothetical protein